MLNCLGVSSANGKIFNANHGGAFMLEGQMSLKENKQAEDIPINANYAE